MLVKAMQMNCLGLPEETITIKQNQEIKPKPKALSSALLGTSGKASGEFQN